MSSQLSTSLLRLKLLDALRSGDTSKVESIIQELSSTKATIQNTTIIQLKETIVHYAVQVAQLPVIQFLVNNADKFGIDINAQDKDGNTPLHLAAATSRLEVVKYLLSLPNINDTIVNLEKKQPVEVCHDTDVAQLMQFERAKFVEKLATQLRHYFTNRDFDNLEKLLVSNPRASELLDINGADPETGNTILHEFIRKNDLEMCDWILKHGGDPFKRDKRGKLPIDLVSSKNEPLKRLIKTASKDQNIMDPVINTNNAIKVGNAPTYKGYLRKWTNFASGYKLRYFVLDQNGILSYYTNQDDTDNACRGSLNLGYASLHLDSSEKLKFEIIGRNGIRWHLKANHPIETNRWVWTLQNAVTIAKDNIKKHSPIATESSEKNFRAEEVEQKRRHLHIPGRRKHKRTPSLLSISSAENEDSLSLGSGVSRSSTLSKKVPGNIQSPNLGEIEEGKFAPNDSKVSDHNSIGDSDIENFDHDMDDIEDGGTSDEDGDSTNNRVLLADQVSTAKNSLQVEINSLLDLFSQVAKAKAAGDSSNTSVEHETFTTTQQTLKGIQDLFEKYTDLVQTQDERNSRKLERQLEVNTLWENSIRQLENEIRNREEKLAVFEGKQKQLKRYLATASPGNLTPSATGSKETGDSRTNSVSGTLPERPDVSKAGKSSISNADRRSSFVDPVLEELLNDGSDDEFFDADEFDDAGNGDSQDKGNDEELEYFDDSADESNEVGAESKIPSETPITGAAPEAVPETDDASERTKINEDESDLNATTSQTLESKSHPPAAVSDSQKLSAQLLQKEGSFLGYDNPPRKKLALDEDNRPKIGLWGILKSMIGKDMTRMTLPVSFNEPTNLLQRLTEDIEYSDLLDKAASYDDSTLRLAYVASFAASEYSSTINRIAKPFNPLLGETFEYCRPDKSYRILTEQVSHHPPISACDARSIKWDYYGENAVEDKFRGRSFDFKHLGRMFCTLRPDNGVIDMNGEEVGEELYTWKKVNTSVVGIMLGNPTVDNYGKMEVKNTTTGDLIIVDMKQRGWKASSAYHLSGQVLDKKGIPQWAIGGKWDSKIFAKKIQESSINTEPGDEKTTTDPFSGGKFLIWQVTPRPKIPFNLTAFATTLNGIDSCLKPWLAPTDTRLRPDQRAMEEGRYDEAADEKHRVEEKQRAARRQRETNKQHYKPNWFVQKRHPVTGDKFWEYNNDYWVRRKDKALSDCGDIF
ncbi:uncharacterized protein PRCAT00005245001 [Priceomyces carsonii]|uniref:uncharacterized protein n=1 Tax=Priceomyces carsonii TaxID=28549 RepID=UPI002ED8D8EC|nr:unnamed protein product [Priceomyces carsonii]